MTLLPPRRISKVSLIRAQEGTDRRQECNYDADMQFDGRSVSNSYSNFWAGSNPSRNDFRVVRCCCLRCMVLPHPTCYSRTTSNNTTALEGHVNRKLGGRRLLTLVSKNVICSNSSISATLNFLEKPASSLQLYPSNPFLTHSRTCTCVDSYDLHSQ